MTAAADLVVVGGGVAGLSLAHALAKRRASVRLLEAGRRGAHDPHGDGAAAGYPGASTVPAALLNPHRGRTARARPSDLSGLEAMWRLVEELEALGLDHGASRSGVYRVASTARQARLWRDVADEHEGAEWLQTGDAFPAVHAPHGGLLVRDGGMVDTGRFLAALGMAAMRAGATVETGTRVVGMWHEAGRTILSTESSAGGDTGATESRTIVARHVVLCVGAAPAPPGCRLPSLSAAGGVAAVLRPAAESSGLLADLPPIAGAVNAAFLKDRIVVTGGSLPAVMPAPDDLRSAASGLRDALAWAVPDVRRASLQGAWFGVRARRPSGTPVVRRLGQHVTYYGGLGGRGYLCAADLSEKLAERLLAGP